MFDNGEIAIFSDECMQDPEEFGKDEASWGHRALVD